MPKQVIDLTSGKRGRITVLSYGPSRAGKTRFAGSFPRPLFLSDKSEGGWETLRYMPDDALYETGRRPEVWPIASAKEMLEALAEVEGIAAKEPDRFRTVVVDSLTFYADSFFAGLEAQAASSSNKTDPRRLYQTLQSHLRYLMIRVHGMETMNVVWLCLEKPPGEDGGTAGGLLLAGQSGYKAPARCDNLFYHRVYRTSESEPPTFEIRTRQFGAYVAGGRDDGTLPDPMEPNYRVMEDKLGLVPFLPARMKAVKGGQ